MKEAAFFTGTHKISQNVSHRSLAPAFCGGMGASLDAREDSKTFTSCLEAWHTIEDIVEDGFDAIIVVPYEVAFPEPSICDACTLDAQHPSVCKVCDLLPIIRDLLSMFLIQF